MSRIMIAALAGCLASGVRAYESSSPRFTNLSRGGGDVGVSARGAAPAPAAKAESKPAPLAAAPIQTPVPLAPGPARRPWGAWVLTVALGLAAALAFHRRDRARARANDESLALAAHELQSPLAAIESYLDLMASEAPVSTQQARLWLEDLGRMRTTTAHLRRTITDILDMTRVEDGRVKLAAGPVDLVSLIAASVSAYAPHAAARGIALKVDAPAGLASALADPDRLRQVLDNLIGNALKFTPSGRAVTVAARATADRVILEVRDEGVGVPAAKRGRLFGKFQRLGPATDGTEGTGLGLYLAQRLVVAQGGTLVHEAAASGGSIFRVTLPRA